jgi:hypothetical protein
MISSLMTFSSSHRHLMYKDGAEKKLICLLFKITITRLLFLELCLHERKSCHFKTEMEQRTLKNVNNCWKTNISFFLETSWGQSRNLYLNIAHFFNTSVN